MKCYWDLLVLFPGTLGGNYSTVQWHMNIKFTNLPRSVALSSHSILPFMSSCDLLLKRSEAGTIGWTKSPWVKPAQSTKCSCYTELLPHRDLGTLKSLKAAGSTSPRNAQVGKSLTSVILLNLCSGVEALLSSPLRPLC